MDANIVNSPRPKARPQAATPVINLQQLWALTVINWRWLVVSVITCLLLAGLFLWFVPPKVTVTGKMEIIDRSNGSSGISAGLTLLNSLPMGLGSSLGGGFGSFDIESEKEIFLSNSLICQVVKDLGLYTEYRHSKWGRKKLLYKDQPVSVTLDPAHVQWLDSELPLTLHQIKLTISKDDENYTVETMLREGKEKIKLPPQTFTSLPATIKTKAGVLTLTENNNLTPKQSKEFVDGYTLKVVINPPSEAALGFIKSLKVEPPSKNVFNMLVITYNDQNVMRGIDFVNQLVKAYNKRANDDKNEEARKTDEFVNARLAMVDAELGSSDADWERYKRQFQITTPEVDAQEVMTKKSLYETELVEIGTQLQLHDYLSDYINDPANLYEIIPLSVGASSVTSKVGTENGVATQSSSLIAQHNEMVNQRRDFMKSMSEKAPQVQRLTESLQELHPVLQTAMKRDRQSLLMKRNNLEREYGRYLGRVGSAPKQERVLTEIGRQREIKQGVYLLMLQKREETAMELANVTDKGKFVDEPQMVKNSAKPQKKLVLIVAAFLGLLIPLIILYLLHNTKNRIEIGKDLSLLTKNPLVGEIPASDNMEAIRNLRTNLLLGMEPDQKVILITSNSLKDGKTYIAKQLTDALQQIGKKAQLLNFNLRESTSDIVSYLPEFKNVHPSDMLAREEFANLMAQLKSQYDYLVIDTPALDKYVDAYQLARFADVTCYIIKADHTPKSIIEKLKKETRLPNIRFVLNAIDMNKRKYKYYYKSL